MARYTVILDPDTEDGGYVVTVPVLPGCVTEGATFEEAVANAEEAIAGFLDALARMGEPIPTEAPGLAVVHVNVEIRDLVPA